MAHDGARHRVAEEGGVHERSVLARDGTSLSVRHWYEGKGTPLVLCDGLGCDGFIWRYIVERFASERPIVHMQYRGHGRSQVPKDLGSMRMDVIIEDIAATLDATGIEKACWLGHSMGVQVALEGFRSSRSRLTGLALLCGGFEKPVETWHHAFFEGDAPPLGNRVMRRLFDGLTRTVIDRWDRIGPGWRKLVASELALRRTILDELNPALVKDEDFRPYMAHLAAMDMRVFASLARELSTHSARDVLPKIDVPTLIVGGGRDRFAPLWLSEEMHRQIPGSEFLPLVQGSHTAPIEEPRLVERALVRLLGRLDASR